MPNQSCGIHVLLEHTSTLGRIITELVRILDDKMPSDSRSKLFCQGAVITHTRRGQLKTGTRNEANNHHPIPALRENHMPCIIIHMNNITIGNITST